jgi:DNA-binding transcriptional regulator YhcF (GntR family)
MRQSTKNGKIIHFIYDMIENKMVLPGDNLPSISEISRTLSVARETVVKAYKILKQEGLIDSVPGKGFYLLTDKISSASRVLLILNSFNPYMQVLYNSFSEALPEAVVADVYFHHNNIDHFRTLLKSYSSRYTHYIIKPFQHKAIPDLLDSLDPKRTLILDRAEYIPQGCSVLCQNFSVGISDALGSISERIKGYNSLNMIRTPLNPHPEESFMSFSTFLNSSALSGEILPVFSEDRIRKGGAYLVLTEQDLVALLQLASLRNWTPGKDIGILSYNDFPLLQYVAGGITSLSVDFKQMGQKAALFALHKDRLSEFMMPQLILRSSL